MARLIEFYDDLTFEERVTRDPREEWYANYELLALRARVGVAPQSQIALRYVSWSRLD